MQPHYLPMPNHVQSPLAVPFLIGEYELLIKHLEELTGKTIPDSDLKRGIKIMNDVRRVMKDIYGFIKRGDPPILGTEAMTMTCSHFFSKDWPERTRLNRVLKFAKDFNVRGAIVI